MGAVVGLGRPRSELLDQEGVTSAGPAPRLAAARRYGLMLLMAAGAAAAVATATQRPIAGRGGSRVSGEVDAAGLPAILAAQKGKVVLLNFWATWCVPCREEFPDLARLQKAYGGRGLRVVGISTDFVSQRPGVEKFLAELDPPFPNYVKRTGGDDQRFIEAVDPSWGGELPFTVLLDRSGRKVKVLSGKHSYAEYEKQIRPLLAR